MRSRSEYGPAKRSMQKLPIMHAMRPTPMTQPPVCRSSAGRAGCVTGACRVAAGAHRGAARAALKTSGQPERTARVIRHRGGAEPQADRPRAGGQNKGPASWGRSLTLGPRFHVQQVVGLVHVPGRYGGADGREAGLHEGGGVGHVAVERRSASCRGPHQTGSAGTVQGTRGKGMERSGRAGHGGGGRS